MNSLAEVKNFLCYDIPYINRGGCGIAALAMYRWLKDRNWLQEDTFIVYMYCYEDGYFDHNQEIIDNGYGEMISCAHAVLHHDGSYHDSNGTHSKYDLNYKNYNIFHEIRDEQVVLDSINNIEAGWNSNFERHFVGDIQSRLNINLTDVGGW